MATPLVAALCGLIVYNSPNISNEGIVEKLRNGCVNINATNPGNIGQLGSGRVNAFNSLNMGLKSYLTIQNNIICNTGGSVNVTLHNLGTASLLGYSWSIPNANVTSGSITSSNSNISISNISFANGGVYPISVVCSLSTGNIVFNSFINAVGLTTGIVTPDMPVCLNQNMPIEFGFNACSLNLNTDISSSIN
jgi:hypothetical protein